MLHSSGSWALIEKCWTCAGVCIIQVLLCWDLFSSHVNTVLLNSRVTGASSLVLEGNGSWGNKNSMQKVTNGFSIIKSSLHWHFWGKKKFSSYLFIFRASDSGRTLTLEIQQSQSSALSSSSTYLCFQHLLEIQKPNADGNVDLSALLLEAGAHLPVLMRQMPSSPRCKFIISHFNVCWEVCSC